MMRFRRARTKVVTRRRDKVVELRPLPGTPEWERGIEVLTGRPTAEELFERMETAEPHPGLSRK